MFAKPIFETLPIALIAVALLLMAFVQHIAVIVGAIVMIIASCYMIYRHVNAIGLSTPSENEISISN